MSTTAAKVVIKAAKAVNKSSKSLEQKQQTSWIKAAKVVNKSSERTLRSIRGVVGRVWWGVRTAGAEGVQRQDRSGLEFRFYSVWTGEFASFVWSWIYNFVSFLSFARYQSQHGYPFELPRRSQQRLQRKSLPQRAPWSHC